MKRLVQGIKIGLAVFVLVAATGIGYFFIAFPIKIPVEIVDARATPERIARGNYLANHVTVCMDCHSTRDWSRFSGPMVSGSEGIGGERFDQVMGLPGVVIAPNLTPTHLGKWTDGEVLRAFTAGLTKTGDPLFPLMPYSLYGQMDRDDAAAIIAYLRTLKPIEHESPRSKLDFPMNVIVRTIPAPAIGGKKPPTSDVLAYGKYVATIAGCIECHTQSDQGKHLPGMDFAGGFRFGFPGGVVRSANITPDPETGIGSWTRESFIHRFKTTVPAPVTPKEFNTPMPWTMYSGMTEEDLGAIFSYLKSVPVVKNKVERFTAGERM